MARSILSIPEDHLLEVIHILRLGIVSYYNGKIPEKRLDKETISAILDWCRENEEYIKGEHDKESL